MEGHGMIVVWDLTPSIEIITFTGSFTATFKPPAKNPESDIANTRTPENALRTHIRNLKIFAIFIQTILVNFYPKNRFGFRLGEFLSRCRIWHDFSLFFAKF